MKLNVGPKISLGFAVVIVLSMIIAGAAYMALSEVDYSNYEQSNIALPMQNITASLNTHAQNAIINLLRFMYNNDDDYFDDIKDSFKEMARLSAEMKRLCDAYPQQTAMVADTQKQFDVMLGPWRARFDELQKRYHQSWSDLREINDYAEVALGHLEVFIANTRVLQNQELDGNNNQLRVRWFIERIGVAEKAVLVANQAVGLMWESEADGNHDLLPPLRAEIADIIPQLEQLASTAVTDANRKEIEDIAQAMKDMDAVVVAFMASSRSKDDLIEELDELNDRAVAMFTEGDRLSIQAVLDSNGESAAMIDKIKLIMIICALATLLVAILVAFRITRMITGPVGEMRHAFSKLVKRDFQISFNSKLLARSDEMGEIVRDVDQVCTVLSDTINDLYTSSENVATAASEINQGNQDLSSRTQQQASTVEQTASALELMTSTVKATAENAGQASQLASHTRQTANRGGQVVQNTVSAMQQVTESSKKINDIIGVVNEIAFQTNLLALNAAVEAARAGDAGRGFAVVAGEVRSLAGRSAGAAKEIQNLITDSVSKIEMGNAMVNESGQLLSEIISDVQKVADTIDEINTTSQEQATSIDEINKAMGLMDQGIQHNAALVEEIAAATDTLSAAASISLEKVSQFNTRSDNRQPYRALPES